MKRANEHMRTDSVGPAGWGISVWFGDEGFDGGGMDLEGGVVLTDAAGESEGYLTGGE